MAFRLAVGPDGSLTAIESPWNNQSLDAPKSAPCPRCDASGEELLFMSFHTCEVCCGAKRVTQIAADAEIARRESERVS